MATPMRVKARALRVKTRGEVSRQIATGLALYVLGQACLTALTLVLPGRVMAPVWVVFGFTFAAVVFAIESYKGRRAR